ncbi:PspC domain-containing protein [Corynebacterium ammoniagenes]|uniref:PspC domain-containing protein n=1 Tax=Corynebacterium ammoniagenes TaxID=1697 RepID=UPI001459EC26|nr:PspC domain-containing protein [Corynebacterium ammoniagenes]NMF31451.1 PspC domain-containing protein [Corynebacterium ammoniagenes]
MSNQYVQYSEQPIQRRRLHRSTTNKYVGGVLGGVAETYNIDDTLVRVLFLLSFFLPGPQLLLYLVLWVVIPAGN